MLSNPVNSRPSVAIVLHLYFADRWPEMSALIRQAPRPFTLFVTIPESSPATQEILADFPEANIRVVPNVGRDVAPFLSLLPELIAFDLVCKLHTKRESKGYREWRIEAARGVLGGPALAELVVDLFTNVSDLMMAGSGAVFVDGHAHMQLSEAHMREFLPDLPKAFGFFSGTMFWARPALFADFIDAFPVSRFEPFVSGDGQLEHAVERLFGARVASLGGAIGLTRIASGVPEMELVPPGASRITDFVPTWKTRLVPRYEGFPPDWYKHLELMAKAPLGI